MPGAALVAVLLLGSSAEAGAVRRCRSDERVWLYERRPNALPGRVSAPETFR